MRRPALFCLRGLIPKGGKIGIAVLPTCFLSQKEESPGGSYAQKFLQLLKILERAMGFEPTTPTLARLCSTSRPGPAASALEGKTSREAV